jgi:integrase/recombinase XerD
MYKKCKTDIFDRLEGAYAPNTLRAYRSDWAHFLGFCENAGLTPLPASPETMEAFIAFEAQHAVATVERRLYSIRKAHELAGVTNPCADIGVGLALRRVRRAKPNRPGQALGVRRDMLEHMIAAQPDTLQGIRNRSLLSIGFDFLARRSELVAIRQDDLKFTPDGALKGMIRKSKTDQYGRGRLVFGSKRSAKLVRKWLRLKPVEIQPVFCAINHGRCEERTICDRNVNDIVKRSIVKVKRCERPSDLEVSGHSLRVGAAQDLLIKGYDLAAIMRAGGRSDPSTVSRYLRFSEHNIWN